MCVCVLQTTRSRDCCVDLLGVYKRENQQMLGKSKKPTNGDENHQGVL